MAKTGILYQAHCRFHTVCQSLSLSPPCSKLPYDVSNDKALEHEPVRQRVATTVKALRDLSDRFQQSIFDSVNKIPYVATIDNLHGTVFGNTCTARMIVYNYMYVEVTRLVPYEVTIVLLFPLKILLSLSLAAMQ